MKRLFATVVATSALALSTAQAQISSVRPWTEGVWDCTVGGTQGRMTWGINAGEEQGRPTECSDPHRNECATLSEGWGVWGGRFEAPPLPVAWLREASRSQHAVFMSVRSGDLWYADEVGHHGVMTGYAMVAGARYPLRCTRSGRRRGFEELAPPQ